jgi:hypothetical protein
VAPLSGEGSAARLVVAIDQLLALTCNGKDGVISGVTTSKLRITMETFVHFHLTLEVRFDVGLVERWDSLDVCCEEIYLVTMLLITIRSLIRLSVSFTRIDTSPGECMTLSRLYVRNVSSAPNVPQLCCTITMFEMTTIELIEL